MTTRTRDAVIKVRLDTVEAQRVIEKMQTHVREIDAGARAMGGGASPSTGGSGSGAPAAGGAAPRGGGSGGGGAAAGGGSSAAQAVRQTANALGAGGLMSKAEGVASKIPGVGAAQWGIEEIVQGIVNSPKFVAGVKGILPEKLGELLEPLKKLSERASDEVIELRAKISAIESAMQSTARTTAGILRLGGKPSLEGVGAAFDFFHKVDAAQEKLRRQVEMDRSVETTELLGKAVRQSLSQ